MGGRVLNPFVRPWRVAEMQPRAAGNSEEITSCERYSEDTPSAPKGGITQMVRDPTRLVAT